MIPTDASLRALVLVSGFRVVSMDDGTGSSDVPDVFLLNIKSPGLASAFPSSSLAANFLFAPARIGKP